jgi:hypothetical protein
MQDEINAYITQYINKKAQDGPLKKSAFAQWKPVTSQ